MTKRERAQVVELLRCAADRRGVATPFGSAEDRLRPSRKVRNMAVNAWNDTYGYAMRWCLYGKRVRFGGKRQWYASMSMTLLEAAARVEEGSWP